MKTIKSIQDPSYSLIEDGIITLFEPITNETTKRLVSGILKINNTENDIEEIKLLICSPGGSLEDTLAIIDIMKSSVIPVSTVALGGIASGAFLIFMNGAPGRRIATPNTLFMSHQFSGGTYGKEHELSGRNKQFEICKSRMFDHYLKNSNLTKEEISNKLLGPTDYWMDPNEAKKFGFVDIIKNFDKGNSNNVKLVKPNVKAKPKKSKEKSKTSDKKENV